MLMLAYELGFTDAPNVCVHKTRNFDMCRLASTRWISRKAGFSKKVPKEAMVQRDTEAVKNGELLRVLKIARPLEHAIYLC